MAISGATRQKMLHRVGKVHESLVMLGSEYPWPSRVRASIWPEELLPYSRRLITELIEAELSDPVVGAAIRQLTVERWQEGLRCLDMALAHDFVPRDEWVRRQEGMDATMAKGEETLVVQDRDSMQPTGSETGTKTGTKRGE